MVVSFLDFEGQNGMLMCIPVWFLGGTLVGMISPGRTFIEPAVAALLVAIPSTFLLIQSQTVRSMPLFLYVIFAGIGILLTLIGAYIGERIQLGPPPKTAESSLAARARASPVERLHDVVIIGGGPAGSVCAARLATLGRQALVLERAHHPRFHLGESLLPGSVAVLEAIGVLDEVRSRFIVKRGARFVDGAGARRAVGVRVRRRVPRSSTTTHSKSPATSSTSCSSGAPGRAAPRSARVAEVVRVVFESGRAVGGRGGSRRGGGDVRVIRARLVVDASGRDALVPRATGQVERLAHLDRTAIFTQVRAAWRDTADREGDIQIVVFGDGAGRGWFWHIPFADGRTSAGAVVSSAWVQARRGLTPAALFDAAVEETPAMAQMLQGSERLFAPRATADFSFRVGSLRGDGWLALGDAGGFIDPLFSTGAHLAMQGALRAADAIDAALRRGDPTPDAFATWDDEMRAGSDLFLGAVQAFYAGDLTAQIFADPQHPFLRTRDHVAPGGRRVRSITALRRRALASRFPVLA